MKLLHSFIALVCIGLFCAVNTNAQSNITFNPGSGDGTTLTWQRVNELLNTEFPGLGLGTSTLPLSGRYSPTLPTFTATIPDGITIGREAFGGLSTLVGVTFPSGSVTIAVAAFVSCIGLTSLVFNCDVTFSGNQAFEKCTGLTSVTFNGNVGDIMSWTFEDCNNLTSVVFNGIVTSMTTINFGVFEGCTKLPSITIPASVERIRDNAFRNCNSLATITFLRATAPTIENNAFDIGSSGSHSHNTNITAINIPAGSTASYTAAINLETHADKDFLISKLVEASRPPRPYRKPGDVRIGGSVNIGKGSTLNIGKP